MMLNKRKKPTNLLMKKHSIDRSARAGDVGMKRKNGACPLAKKGINLKSRYETRDTAE